MNRFARYKTLQLLWTRARMLLAFLHGPRHQEARLRAQRWQEVQVAQRLISDGIIRGSGDPDSASRPRGDERRASEQQARRWEQIHRAVEANREATHRWMESQRQQRRGR
jgi:hypothetical protein